MVIVHGLTPRTVFLVSSPLQRTTKIQQNSFISQINVSLFVGASDGREVGERPEDPDGAFPAQTRASAETQPVQLSRHRHEAAGRQHGREPVTRSPAELTLCIVGNAVREEELEFPVSV